MAADAVAPGAPSGPGAGILTSDEFARRVHIRRVQTAQELCAAGQVPGASKIGHEWRIHWPTFYAAVAGPGIPLGEILTSRQLAQYLRVDEQVVRRASAAPGTPDKLPGRQLGKTWLHAWPAVCAYTGWPLDDGPEAAAPGPPAAGPAPAQPAPPPASYPAQSLDFPAPAPGRALAARSPGRGAGAAARHRRPRPGPGSSPAAR